MLAKYPRWNPWRNPRLNAATQYVSPMSEVDPVPRIVLCKQVSRVGIPPVHSMPLEHEYELVPLTNGIAQYSPLMILDVGTPTRAEIIFNWVSRDPPDPVVSYGSGLFALNTAFPVWLGELRDYPQDGTPEEVRRPWRTTQRYRITYLPLTDAFADYDLIPSSETGCDIPEL